MRRSWAACRAGGRKGQVIIEVLLVLPVFLWLVFMIMEIGHLAFRTILLHHAAYEVARYGSLTDSNQKEPLTGGGCNSPNPNRIGMESIARRILPTSHVEVSLRPTQPTDTQSQCTNYDLLVTIRQDVPMVFPMTGIWLADKGRRTRKMVATVPMPVEMPLFR
ncbi:MAG: pilus assembly protein [Elusimicrobia bacterium]|nr:pilus assembly protein [Elusimicrobiota bacterium]